MANELEVVPEEIGNLKKVFRLGLKSNKLKYEESSSFQMTFRLCCFHGRNFSPIFPFSVNLRFLPASIGDMEGLVELFLTDNKLEALPPSIAKLSKLFKFQVSNTSKSFHPATLQVINFG